MRRPDYGILEGDGGGSGFEGELTVEVHNPRPLAPEEERYRDHAIRFEVKGDAYRWSLLNDGTVRGDYRIYDRSQHHFLTVLSSQGTTLLTMDLGVGYDAGIPYTLEDLHTQLEIDHHKCEMYETYGGGFHYRVCATPDFVPIPLHFISYAFDQVLPFDRQLQEMNLFPMMASKAAMQTPDGGTGRAAKGGGPKEIIVVTLRVRSVEAKPIPSSEFELPNFPTHLAPTLTTTAELKR